MTAVLQEALKILCRFLGKEALAVGDIARVERWTQEPGFTVDGFRKLVLQAQQRGTLVSSVKYFEQPVAQWLRPVANLSAPRQPMLLTARPWPDYLACYIAQYGHPDVQTVMDLWHRYNGERQVCGLPIEEGWWTREISDLLPTVSGGELADGSLPVTA